MKFQIDHDYHIHSFLSDCSRDPEQNPQRILRYAEENGLRDICLTDHGWDASVSGASDWYRRQPLEHIRRALPLPQSDTVRFHFGCETDMDKHLMIGMSLQALRPYRIAKQCGCKFYLGSDAHHPEDFAGMPEQFRTLVSLLDLQESDKFRPFG